MSLSLSSKLLVISGPTATGKTKTSIEMAKSFQEKGKNAEILNCDSLYFYKELSIATAKPSVEEMAGVTHHLIGFRSIQEPLNAADFAKFAEDILKNKNPDTIIIVVGGSGLYLQALLKGMFHSPTTKREVLQRSQELYEKEGIAPFLKELANVDPESFQRYHENDHYRIRRALEHFWSNGTAFSKERVKLQEAHQEGKIKEKDHFHFHLDIPREDHWKIIENRTEEMIKQGLLEEVENLLKAGFSSELRPLQSIGTKQAIEYLQGNIQSLEEMKEKINIATRQLAKAQRTWFKRLEGKTCWNPLEKEKREQVFSEVMKDFL